MVLTIGLTNVAVYNNTFGAKTYASQLGSIIGSVGCSPTATTTNSSWTITP